MNARSSIPAYRHEQNRAYAVALRGGGYRIEVNSQGYQVWNPCGGYLGGAATARKPHGAYAQANIEENLNVAVQLALRHKESAQAGGES